MTYFITNSGVKIDLEKITIDDISLNDIAHHLTKICRYGGALELNKHYSVANHSVSLFYYALDNGLSEEVQRNILMHDAAETYLGDLVAGLKRLLLDYKEIESYVEKLICEKYQLSTNIAVKAIVKDLDSRIVLDEAKVLFSADKYVAFEQQHKIQPLGIDIKLDSLLSLRVTKYNFLHCCNMVGIYD